MRAPAETAPDISKILLQRTTYPFNSSDFRYEPPQAGNRRPCGVSTARARQAVSPFLPVREPMVPRNALLFLSSSHPQPAPLKCYTPASDTHRLGHFQNTFC